MSRKETTKRGKSAAGQPLESSSPTGHEEIEEHASLEVKGNQEVPPERARKRNPPVHNADMPTNRNPKHTGKSPRTD